MAIAKILSDKNCEGHVTAIYHALDRFGFVELLEIAIASFADIGLAQNADDETVWETCQQNGYFLITSNRTTADGDDSLEYVLQRRLTHLSLPVLTIGDPDRVLNDRLYCEQCALTVARVLMYFEENYRGTPRLFIPFQNI